ncbi:DUF5659 domain-containing protein [Metabacillus halosaccharovorans]|uniref:DUF5659 domain-containing protein n=1 Tax=Metabacillus halosaccharovorans TaxID=930124 RepID=UPI000995C695
MISNQFFFCYSKELAIHLHRSGIQSITTALSPSSGKKFTLFVKSPELQEVINNHNNSKQQTIQ